MLLGNLGDGIDEALACESPGTDGDHDRRLIAGSDDHMVGLRRAVHEVPRAQLALLVLDDQEAGSGHYEERLLRVLPVISPQNLARLEDVDVEAELPKRPLALEVAEEA